MKPFSSRRKSARAFRFQSVGNGRSSSATKQCYPKVRATSPTPAINTLGKDMTVSQFPPKTHMEEEGSI